MRVGGGRWGSTSTHRHAAASSDSHPRWQLSGPGLGINVDEDDDDDVGEGNLKSETIDSKMLSTWTEDYTPHSASYPRPGVDERFHAARRRPDSRFSLTTSINIVLTVAETANSLAYLPALAVMNVGPGLLLVNGATMLLLMEAEHALALVLRPSC